MDKKLKEVSQFLFPEKNEIKTPSQKFDEILKNDVEIEYYFGVYE